MQSLEAACEEAELLLHRATKWPWSVPALPESSLHNKLRQIHAEQATIDLRHPNKFLKTSSHLLEKLVAREKINTLIINLYPGNKGYSLAFRVSSTSANCTITSGGNSPGSSTADNSVEELLETMRYSYLEEELLTYLDNEELPPALVDMMEIIEPPLFYQGCVVAEVRDYRQTFPHSTCQTHHVLLKPTNQTLANDVNLLTSNGDYTREEKLALEQRLCLVTQDSICIDTSPALLVASNRLHYYQKVLSTVPLRKCARKFSQISVNRKRKLDQFTAHYDLPLQDFLSRRRAKTRNVPVTNAKFPKKMCENGLPGPPPVPIPLESLMPELSMPEGGVDVSRYARAYERPRDTSDCTPQLIEEFVFETERSLGRIYYVKLTILQRPSNLEYMGEMYVDRDFRKEHRNGTSCRFSLGTRLQANRYIQQFTEVFTKEGSKAVRITHLVPGQPSRVTSTASMREREAKVAAMQAAQQQAAQQLQQQMQLQQQLQVQQQQQQQLQANQNHVPTVHIQQAPAQIQVSANHLQLQQVMNQAQAQQIANQIQAQQLQQQQQQQQQHITLQQVHQIQQLHQPQIVTVNSLMSPPPATATALPSNVPVPAVNSSSSSLSAVPVTLSNVSNGTILTSNLLGSATVIPNVTNTLSSPPSVGVRTPLAGVVQNTASNGTGATLLNQSHQQQQQQHHLHHHHQQQQTQVHQQQKSSPSSINSSSSSSRHTTNPAISALVTSLMNSAQQFQQEAAAAAAAKAAAQSSSNVPTPAPTSASSSSNNATILNLLNSGTLNSVQPVTANNISVAAQTLTPAQKQLLARKMTWNLVNSRMLNHNNIVNSANIANVAHNAATGGQQQPQQQSVRVSLSSLASQLSLPPSTTSPPPQTQTFTISANQAGYTTIATAPNVSFTAMPFSAANTSGGKAQTVTLNHSGRLVSAANLPASNTSTSVRRLSGATVVNDSGSSSTPSSLGLSVPGLCALLAGSPSADNPIPGSTNSGSTLLERLTASSSTTCASGTAPTSPYATVTSPKSHPQQQFLAQSPSPKMFASPSPKAPVTPSPLSSPPHPVNVNLQRLSLASLQGAMASIQGLQNVQVSFPGLAVPISVSLNVSAGSAHPAGVIVTTLPVTTSTATCTSISSIMSSAVTGTSPLGSGSSPTMVLTNSSSSNTGPMLSLPVAQLMTSGVKGLSSQNLRSAGPTASVSLGQAGGQAILTLQRPRGIVSANQLTVNKHALAAKGLLNTQRLKVAPAKSGTAQLSAGTLTAAGVPTNQVVTLNAQQQLQIALQKKQAQLQQQCLMQQQQKANLSPAAMATKHRRRSNAADPNK